MNETRFYSILTLRGAEIGKIPDKFADKETFVSQLIECLEMSREQFLLIFFAPYIFR